MEIGELGKSRLDLFCWFYGPKNVMATMLTVPIKLKTVPIVSKASTLGVAQKIEETAPGREPLSSPAGTLLTSVMKELRLPPSLRPSRLTHWREQKLHLGPRGNHGSEQLPAEPGGCLVVSSYFCRVKAPWQSQLFGGTGVWQKKINK